MTLYPETTYNRHFTVGSDVFIEINFKVSYRHNPNGNDEDAKANEGMRGTLLFKNNSSQPLLSVTFANFPPRVSEKDIVACKQRVAKDGVRLAQWIFGS